MTFNRLFHNSVTLQFMKSRTMPELLKIFFLCLTIHYAAIYETKANASVIKNISPSTKYKSLK